MTTATRKAPLGAEIVLLLSVGALLGLAYNALGLQEGHDWGVAWRGVDRVKELQAAPMVEPVVSEPSARVSDDPLAVPAVHAAVVPEIPDVGRPVQIEFDAVRQLVESDAALLIDARESWEHAEGHIPGSISLPYDEVITDPVRLESLATAGRPIVVYCGGGSCEVSLSLAWELLAAGHTRIAVYMGGFPEWERAGLPVGKPEPLE